MGTIQSKDSIHDRGTKVKRADKLAKQAEQLSQAMPPGTLVNYWPGVKSGPPKTGRIKHPFMAASYNVVGWVDTHRACIAASHIEPV